ncbi:MAG TPA: tripartite tricarboxylate transporter substrate binding protein [Xanthobacteraceae bacterium]|jgi:tripartite-type tricarboxylate transporter receptor subunit TctC|nr:tripartite tricarboxylate transporter substrate binding protein [Xanthobacteraceae bacterium]
MVLGRRKFLYLAAATAAEPLWPDIVRADDYPSRPVRIIAGYPAGASPDIIVRLISDALSQRLGQQFIVDNRPGAASNIATELVAHSPPDGYTLLIAVSTNAINTTLYSNLSFSFTKDFVPAARIGVTSFLIAANLSFPAKTLPELIAYAKANPGKVNFASQGVGTGPHVAGELFKMMTGCDLVHVPYKGNYNSDLLGGQIPLAFSPIAQVIEFIKDGRLRALGVTTAARSEALPDVPAIGEVVPGYDAAGWYGIVAPKETPAAVIDKLQGAVIAAVNDAQVKSRLLAIGVVPKPLTSAEFSKFIAAETEKWAKVIKFAGLKVE